MPEHEHRPHPQCAAGGVENDADPADGVAVEGPEYLPIRVGRQPGVERADHREGDENPAIGPILSVAGAQIAAAEHSPRRPTRKLRPSRQSAQDGRRRRQTRPSRRRQGRERTASPRRSSTPVRVWSSWLSRKVPERPGRNTIHYRKRGNVCRSGHPTMDRQSTSISELGGVEADPERSRSFGVTPPAAASHTPKRTPDRLAPARSAPPVSAPTRTAPARSASRRMASRSTAWFSFVPCRRAWVRSARVRFARGRCANDRLHFRLTSLPVVPTEIGDSRAPARQASCSLARSRLQPRMSTAGQIGLTDVDA